MIGQSHECAGNREAVRHRWATAGRRGTLVVIAATLVMAIGFGGLGLVSVFMAPMEADLGWTRSNTSLGYSLAAIGMAIGGLLWGRVSDQLDIRLPLAIGATGMVSSLFTMAMVHSLPTFYIANLIYGGLGFSVLYVPLISTSGEWFPQQRGLVTGMVTAGGALGQGLLPFAGRFLIEGFGWRLAFAGIGGVMLAALALSLPILRWPQGTMAPPATVTDWAKRAGPNTRRWPCWRSPPICAVRAWADPWCIWQASSARRLRLSGDRRDQPSDRRCSSARSGEFARSGADRLGALTSYAMASTTQTAAVLVFPALGDSLSFMAVSAVFGFGFAGNMTSLSLCVRAAVRHTVSVARSEQS